MLLQSGREHRKLPSEALPNKTRSRRSRRCWRTSLTACIGPCPGNGSTSVACVIQTQFSPPAHSTTSRMHRSGQGRLRKELLGREHSPPARLHALYQHLNHSRWTSCESCVRASEACLRILCFWRLVPK